MTWGWRQQESLFLERNRTPETQDAPRGGVGDSDEPTLKCIIRQMKLLAAAAAAATGAAAGSCMGSRDLAI